MEDTKTVREVAVEQFSNAVAVAAIELLSKIGVDDPFLLEVQVESTGVENYDAHLRVRFRRTEEDRVYQTCRWLHVGSLNRLWGCR